MRFSKGKILNEKWTLKIIRKNLCQMVQLMQAVLYDEILLVMTCTISTSWLWFRLELNFLASKSLFFQKILTFFFYRKLCTFASQITHKSAQWLLTSLINHLFNGFKQEFPLNCYKSSFTWNFFTLLLQFRRLLREMKENRLKMGARRVVEFSTCRKTRLSFIVLESFFMLTGTRNLKIETNFTEEISKISPKLLTKSKKHSLLFIPIYWLVLARKTLPFLLHHTILFCYNVFSISHYTWYKESLRAIA